MSSPPGNEANDQSRPQSAINKPRTRSRAPILDEMVDWNLRSNRKEDDLPRTSPPQPIPSFELQQQDIKDVVFTRDSDGSYTGTNEVLIKRVWIHKESGRFASAPTTTTTTTTTTDDAIFQRKFVDFIFVYRCIK